MQFRNFSLTYILFLLHVTIGSVKSEFFSAHADLEALVQTESVVVAKLDSYIRLQEERLRQLRRKKSLLLRENKKAVKNIEAYLANPVSAFQLIKRLTIEWSAIKQLMSYNVDEHFMGDGSNIAETFHFPSHDDLSGAVAALLRIQNVYELSTTALAGGALLGTEMTANDCFEVGRRLYNDEELHSAVLWLREALSRLDAEKSPSVEKVEILHHLSVSLYLLGNVETALEYVNDILKLVPDHQYALSSKKYYEKLLAQGNYQNLEIASKPNEDGHPLFVAYKKLCRGEILRNAMATSHLKCHYVTTGSPFLRIAPLKLEQVHSHPNIVVYHNVLSDTEISVLKRLAKPRFDRAYVENHHTGEVEVSRDRVAKLAWLDDQDHAQVRAISRRVEDMTGLSMETAEALQVVNYGLGGHYGSHYDFFLTDDFPESNITGNRIATVLFYMSDVSRGGATVFPKIGVSVKPQKGTAVVWNNLHSSGERDFSTAHGACPVLVGSKWVANKWIRERGQELRRRCDPSIDE